jgi:hypothetical protein
MSLPSNEARVLLAIEALNNDPKASIRAIAHIYNVDRKTLTQRRNGRTARRDTVPNSRKLTVLEEEAIVKRVLELDARSFPPRVCTVQDMANRLLNARNMQPVGKHWATNFIKRHTELKTHFSRKYDYQRAKCEDPAIISKWFTLVQSIIIKYGILEEDIYNFDETGFMMGIISTTMVVTSSEKQGKAKLSQPGNREWATVIQGIGMQKEIPPFIILAGQYHLAHWYTECNLPSNWRIATTENGWTTNEMGLEWVKHFNQHTERCMKGTYRLLILDGHKSHHSDEFETYCEEHNIITLCMPAHSSHLLQPLNVGCFGPLKKVYGHQIEEFMRTYVNHITKVEFLCAFREAYFTSMTEKNIRGSFAATGLIPYNPERVLSKLDVLLRTPSPSNLCLSTTQSWVSKTPQNLIEANSQSTLIKTRISNHLNSSPTSMLTAVDQFAKGAKAIMHRLVLVEAELSTLQKANEALSKRRKAKRTRVQQRGVLTVQDAEELLDVRALTKQAQQEMQQSKSWGNSATTRTRHCGMCGKTGHNARTCQNDEESSITIIP